MLRRFSSRQSRGVELKLVLRIADRRSDGRRTLRLLFRLLRLLTMMPSVGSAASFTQRNADRHDQAEQKGDGSLFRDHSC